MRRSSTAVLAVGLVCAVAAAPAYAGPVRNGAIAIPFADNTDNGSATGGNPHPVRHGFLTVSPSGQVRPNAWCQHRWEERAPCRGFTAMEYSPDGQTFAIAGFSYGLETARSDGSGRRQILDVGSSAQPSWSPDGRRIAFARGDVFVADADGGRLRRLTRTAAFGPFGEGQIASVAWSARNRLAAARTRRGGSVDVLVFRPSGRGERRVYRTRGEAATLDWSPNGRRLLVSVNQRVVAVDPTRRRRPRLLRRHATGARWSPDGRRIAYFKTKRRHTIGIARRSGRGERRVSLRENETGFGDDEFFRDYGPLTWQPVR
jgi:dipeptidyl aminopeptidase/acylaminoacyl peptidase